MYSEGDVHLETYIDPLVAHLRPQDNPDECAVGTVITAEHPTTVFTIRQHDGRVFRTTITTEEI